MVGALDGIVGSIGGSVVTGLMGSHAANKAASQQAGGYNQAAAYLSPYASFGANQLNPLMRAMSSSALSAPFRFSGANLADTPGYQFTLGQGLKAATNSAAAKGLGLSGAQMRGVSQFATGLAQNTYNDEYNRQFNTWQGNMGQAQQRVNNLMGVVNTGMNAAGAMGQNAIGAAAARAGGTVGGTNALTGAIGNITAPWDMQRLTGMYSTGLPSGSRDLGSAMPWL